VPIPDLFWFLLPIAAAAGWFAARRSEARSSKNLWDYTSEFHQNLNVLLTDQQDQAVDLFTNSDSSDRNTAETHIALGNYYRQRGDMERALFMHQSVLDNEKLDQETRATARYELASDYVSAGLLDRSENVLRELINSGHRQQDAYRSLLQMHEREGDWSKAISVATEAQSATQETLGHRIALYYCELAEDSKKFGSLDEVQAQLELALENDDKSARAIMMLADLAMQKERFDQANELYEQVQNLRPELMPEIIERRFEVFKQAKDDKALEAFLKRIQEQRNAYSVIRTTRSVISERYNDQLADRFFKDQILKRPSLKGLRDWVHDQIEHSKAGEREKVRVIRDLLDQVVEDKPLYRCSSCGFQGNVMHWRCPSCEQWDSVSTIIGVEGELTRLKIGNQLFTVAGPAFVDYCQAKGFDVFLDLKYHDIPNTVASALEAAASLGVWMVNVHASGGPAMLSASRDAISQYDRSAVTGGGTRIIGVTVLTSLDHKQLSASGLDVDPAEHVARLAKLTREAALDGVVCSPHEVGLIRSIAKNNFLIVTPGVRPDPASTVPFSVISSHGGKPDDQLRTLTPFDAILAGSDYLVIGRPITQAASPVDVLAALAAEVQIAASQAVVGQ